MIVPYSDFLLINVVADLFNMNYFRIFRLSKESTNIEGSKR